MATGKLVNCGGGVQLRFRSCTEPTPRFHGKVCWGWDIDYQPCKTNDCQLPIKYLWSPWGPPPVCTTGNQTRNTMCGGLRRRLPNLPGRSDGDPPVSWPSCLKPISNTASQALKVLRPNDDFESCYKACNDNSTSICSYWTYNFTSKDCQFFSIMIASTGPNLTDVLSGERDCSGKLFFPYCAYVNKTYPSALLTQFGSPFNTTMEICTHICYVDTACNYWLYVIEDQMCSHFTNQKLDPTKMIASTLTSKTSYFGFYTCLLPKELPALPEDAEELSYVAQCQGDQYDAQANYTNTWNITTCPSPCVNNGNCTRYSQCIDLSTDIAPNYTCVCTMAKQMVGGRCIDPPITTPTPRAIPTMPSSTRSAATAVTSTACFVLIGFLSFTLILFAVFRIIDRGRFIHMNIEIALLCAHICLLLDAVGNDVLCRNVSICLHFFFTVVFAFFTLEAVHMFSILGHIVPRDGMLSYFGNFCFGWGSGILVIAYSISFEYQNYGGVYYCWLDMGSSLMFAEFTPLVLFTVMTVMLIEAAGSVDENTMMPLDDEDEIQRKSAKYMQGSLVIRLFLCLVSFITGSLAQYEQSLALFFVFTVVNGVLGGFIFFSHCTCNQKIRSVLAALWAKVFGKNKTETEPLTSKRSSIMN